MTAYLQRHIVPILVTIALLLGGLLLLARSASANMPVSPAKDAQRRVQNPVAPTSTPTPTSTPACGLAWRRVSSPSVTGTDNTLAGITAISANDVWAVGSTGPRGARRTLIEHWDGVRWSIVPSPNVSGYDNHLQAIDSLSADDIWAVGNAGDLTLTLHWDGALWSIVPSASPSQAGNYLNAVSAASSNDVWVAGYYSDGILNQTMVEHWNGAQWSVVPSLSIKTANNVFLGAKALSANDAWVVGFYSMEGVLRTLIEHWDGTQWSIVPSPNVGPWSAVMSLSAVTPDDIWSVGAYSDDSPLQTLVEHWDGSQWSVVPSPSIEFSTTTLSAVAAISSSDVWAVGQSWETDQPVIEHWNGSQWSIVTGPSKGMLNNLNSVAAISGNDVWAVGDYTNEAETVQTLAAHYNDPCALITPTPTATSTPATTPTPCALHYSDVSPSDYFYQAVQYLSCAGAVSGYADGTFRPYNNTTRGQLTKIVILAEGWPINNDGGPHFSDVHIDNPFYDYVETAYNRNIITGYSDGAFRWQNNITRAQLCKVTVLAQGWPIDTTGGPHFTDVSPGHPFYQFIETTYNHGVISGYSDRTFRPENNATRGQVCKIIYDAVRNEE